MNVYYKLAYKGNYADVDKQFSLHWDDPKLKINWPIRKIKGKKKPILSKRDRM